MKIILAAVLSTVLCILTVEFASAQQDGAARSRAYEKCQKIMIERGDLGGRGGRGAIERCVTKQLAKHSRR
jgi:hypothetical protein